jgi:hypothetical protein
VPLSRPSQISCAKTASGGHLRPTSHSALFNKLSPRHQFCTYLTLTWSSSSSATLQALASAPYCTRVMVQWHAFFSKQIAPRHTKLAAYERELISLVQVIQH